MNLRTARSCRSGSILAGILFLAACTSIVDHFSGRAEACRILAGGTAASGRIVRLVDTGTTINKDPVVGFVLEVTAPEGDPFEAYAEALISRLDIPQVQPGRVLPVKYDPKDRSRVAIDLWDCD